jgi:hypothetical protein
MANGTVKKIQEVQVGELVRGIKGEANEVLALDWSILGPNRFVYHLNDEHYTTDEHPHIGFANTFYAIKPASLATDWGLFHPVLLPSGIEWWRNRGVALAKVYEFGVGSMLLTETGYQPVTTLVQCDPKIFVMDTKLYNLVLGGSHTYFVDGYAVTGWPRDDDFDYTDWKSKGAAVYERWIP